MATCDSCGNDYAEAFTLNTAAGESFTFDSFECAIERVAPRCAHCQVRIIGHGHQAGDQQFCCAHCARSAGVGAVRDNAEA